MLQCNQDEQWSEALGIWADRKVVTYLKEHHPKFEAILKKQDELANNYSIIAPFLNDETPVSLTADEHKAVLEYFRLREEMEYLIREYHFYLGQVIGIPGLQTIHYNNEDMEKVKERKSQLLDILAEGKMEGMENRLLSENQEYHRMDSETIEKENVVKSLRLPDEVTNAVDEYVSAVNSQWLLYSQLLYQCGIEDILALLQK